MRIQHSFFITDQIYCKKVEGLIGYLAEKINIGLLCLYCENQGIRDFKSAEAVRSHMVNE
jgi:pre-60S factor REI1